MTVKELIQLLTEMPQDAKVMYYDGDDGWVTPNVEYVENAKRYAYNPSTETIGSVVSLTAD